MRKSKRTGTIANEYAFEVVVWSSFKAGKAVGVGAFDVHTILWQLFVGVEMTSINHAKSNILRSKNLAIAGNKTMFSFQISDNVGRAVFRLFFDLVTDQRCDKKSSSLLMAGMIETEAVVVAIECSNTEDRAAVNASSMQSP